MSDRPPIVLDQGTGFVKVGYAGTNFPEQQYPSIVGRPILRAEERSGDVEIKDIMVGEEAAQVRSMLQISYPVRSERDCCTSVVLTERRWRTELSATGRI